MKQPIAGIEGSPRGRTSKELDAEYRKHRNEQLRLRNLKEALLIAKARGELVSKSVAQLQAANLIVALRSKLLTIPQSHARRLLDISDYETMAAKLKEIALSTLREIENLPRAVGDPEWEDRGEGGEPKK